MEITNFEDTGLEKIGSWIEKNNIKELNEQILKEALKTVNISFVAEEIDRIQSTLLCELKDSYVQQSQRYVTMGDHAYILPTLSEKDHKRAQGLIKKTFILYGKMSVLNEGDFKGRPKIENYKYGIPIEDARYILPLCTKTNLSIAMTGDKLYELFYLMGNKKYIGLFNEFKVNIIKYLPEGLIRLLPNSNNDNINKELIEVLYHEEMEKIDIENNMVLLGAFNNLDLKVGLGALTSTLGETPSEKLEKWGDESLNKAKAVANRVLSYGHDSIAEQARTTFGMMCSLVTYHQQIRHRLSQNHREDLLNIILDKNRPVIVPPNIRNSVFHQEFLELVNELKEFRLYVYEQYGEDKALPFLLNCDPIKLISSTNARMDHTMLAERICLNAQWEIRELATKKLMILRKMSDVLYEKALPSCVYGNCKEGKLSCGKQRKMRSQFL